MAHRTASIPRCQQWSPLVLGLVSLLVAEPSRADSGGTIGRQWPASQRISMNDIDHSAWDALLQKYVDRDGYVDYAAWQKSRDRTALQSYLAHLGRASSRIPASREARLAFWINAYNATTVEGILRVYPTTSIRRHTARVAGYNIWKDLLLRVDDRTYSLDAMEHQVLRKTGEPRIHFAIVCASVGCPRLLAEAYTAEKLEAQLAANARDFFSRPKHFRHQRGSIAVSAILDWFDDDFGPSNVARFRSLAAYLPEDARRIATDPRTRVQYLEYDWSLNDQSLRVRNRAKAASTRSQSMN